MARQVTLMRHKLCSLIELLCMCVANAFRVSGKQAAAIWEQYSRDPFDRSDDRSVAEDVAIELTIQHSTLAR